MVTDEETTKGIAYGSLVGYLVESIKELKSRIETLENKFSHSLRKRTWIRRYAVEFEIVGVAIHKHRLQTSRTRRMIIK